MAILYGTTGDGTTLPVLVDQFGNLLAKGIEGPQGPEGPPGTGELPPGEDGQVLMLVNGQPEWADIDIGPALKWSDFLTDSSGQFGTVSTAKFGFDGLESTSAVTNANSQILWYPPLEINLGKVETSFAYPVGQSGWSYQTETSGIFQSFAADKASDEWYVWSRLAGVTIGPNTPLVFYLKDETGLLITSGFSRLRINNNVLVDFQPVRISRVLNQLNRLKD